MAESVKIPLLVNVMKGVTISKEDLAKMVDAANKLLKQAGISLDWDPANLRTDVEGQGNDKTDVNEDNPGDLGKNGLEELKKKFGEGKGYKIYLAKDIFKETGNHVALGFSNHDPKAPVSYIWKFGTPEEIGNTLAHEFCHVFTLGKNHLIAKGPEEKRADDKGHSDDSHNLMSPDRSPERTELTDAQKEEIRKGCKARGRMVRWLQKQGRITQVSRGETEQSTWSNDGAEGDAPAHVHVASGSLTEDGGRMEIDLHLAGCFPKGKIRQRLEVYLGGDASLEILISGTYPFRGAAGEVISRLREGAKARVITPAQVDRVYRIIEGVRPRRASTRDVCDVILQTVRSRDVLGGRKPRALRVLSVDLSTGAAEASAVRLDWSRRPSPRISIGKWNVAPGRSVRIAGVGFTPDRRVTVSLDDVAIHTAMSDESGRLNAKCPIPAAEAGWYFLTVRDESRGFDFSVVQVMDAV